MKPVFYNAIVYNKLSTTVEGIYNEEDLKYWIAGKSDSSWEAFYYALKAKLINQQGGYHVIMNQFSKLSD